MAGPYAREFHPVMQVHVLPTDKAGHLAVEVAYQGKVCRLTAIVESAHHSVLPAGQTCHQHIVGNRFEVDVVGTLRSGTLSHSGAFVHLVTDWDLLGKVKLDSWRGLPLPGLVPLPLAYLPSNVSGILHQEVSGEAEPAPESMNP
ncbi:hypothetical protein D7W82_22530 [Corallococcus sp. CA049B]|nr:hypothetical protein D7W82_22530 [Corallococcus sp. CA049B]